MSKLPGFEFVITAGTRDEKYPTFTMKKAVVILFCFMSKKLYYFQIIYVKVC